MFSARNHGGWSLPAPSFSVRPLPLVTGTLKLPPLSRSSAMDVRRVGCLCFLFLASTYCLQARVYSPPYFFSNFRFWKWFHGYLVEYLWILSGNGGNLLYLSVQGESSGSVVLLDGSSQKYIRTSGQEATRKVILILLLFIFCITLMCSRQIYQRKCLILGDKKLRDLFQSSIYISFTAYGCCYPWNHLRFFGVNFSSIESKPLTWIYGVPCS